MKKTTQAHAPLEGGSAAAPPSRMMVDTGRSLTIALLRAREALMVHFRPMLARHDLTEQQWRVLRVCAEVEEVDASQIAERSCILAPSLTRILRALEERGLLVRHRDEADGRRQIVSLTREGLSLMRDVAPEGAAIYGALESRYGREWIDDLLERLVLLRGFEEELHGGRNGDAPPAGE